MKVKQENGYISLMHEYKYTTHGCMQGK